MLANFDVKKQSIVALMPKNSQESIHAFKTPKGSLSIRNGVLYSEADSNNVNSRERFSLGGQPFKYEDSRRMRKDELTLIQSNQSLILPPLTNKPGRSSTASIIK